jgi:ribosomal protein L30/L7E
VSSIPSLAQNCNLIVQTSINEIAPKPRKILQLLRLIQINSGVFVRVTKATQQMLRLVEPYVTYGYVKRSFVLRVQHHLLFFFGIILSLQRA